MRLAEKVSAQAGQFGIVRQRRKQRQRRRQLELMQQELGKGTVTAILVIERGHVGGGQQRRHDQHLQLRAGRGAARGSIYRLRELTLFIHTWWRLPAGNQTPL